MEDRSVPWRGRIAAHEPRLGATAIALPSGGARLGTLANLERRGQTLLVFARLVADGKGVDSRKAVIR